MKQKQNLGCLTSGLLIVLILTIPSVLYHAYVMQKMALWFFHYEHSLVFFIGVSTFGNMFASKFPKQKQTSTDRNKGEGDIEYTTRLIFTMLGNAFLLPTFYLAFSYFITSYLF